MARSRTVRVVCKSPEEAEQIQRALDDPMTRAFVSIVGTLLPLGERARTRVLTYVNDKLNEDAGRVLIESHGTAHDVEVEVDVTGNETRCD